MSKTIVVYYSRTGNNRFLANQMAQSLNSDIEQIKPWLNVFMFLLLFSKSTFSFGIRSLKHNLADYERVVLIGPVWMGQLVSPLRDFIKKYKPTIEQLYFATCCGSYDAIKDEKYGYAFVFAKINGLLGNKLIDCEAFPIAMVVPEDQIEDSESIMKARLSDKNFKGEMFNRFSNFVQKIATKTA